MEVPSILRGESRKRRLAEHFRFEGVADAIRFAFDGLPSPHLEVAETRFGCREIRRLYDRSEFPLARRMAA
jgi:hypothetical protein